MIRARSRLVVAAFSACSCQLAAAWAPVGSSRLGLSARRNDIERLFFARSLDAQLVPTLLVGNDLVIRIVAPHDVEDVSQSDGPRIDDPVAVQRDLHSQVLA